MINGDFSGEMNWYLITVFFKKWDSNSATFGLELYKIQACEGWHYDMMDSRWSLDSGTSDLQEIVEI